MISKNKDIMYRESSEYQFYSILAADKSASTLRLFWLQSQLLSVADIPDRYSLLYQILWDFRLQITLSIHPSIYPSTRLTINHTCRNTRISGSGRLVILGLTSPKSHFDIVWPKLWHINAVFWWNFGMFWSLPLPE